MYSRSRLARCAAAAVAALALTSCATMRVNWYVERGTNVAGYRTYNWGPVESFATGDPRLDNSPFFQDHLRADVDTQLASRGFERTTSGTPDLLIHYHASVNQRVDVNEVDRSLGYPPAAADRPYVYEAGTLVLDFVDARTNKVIWRGWAEGIMDGVIDNQEWMEREIDQAVLRILDRFPRAL